MNYRIYNDFKNRLLRGVVPSSFDCRAVLVNANYEQLGDNVLYCRTVEDFGYMSAGSLYYTPSYLDNTSSYVGSIVATADIYDTTYYRTDELAASDAITDLKIVTSANSGYYSRVYHRSSTDSKRFADYLRKYGYFYLVTRADEFYTLVDHCKNTDIETFAVVLGDDIEHVSVTGSCFGNSREHPFRGVFDGNGFALCVSDMLINSRSNGIFGYIAEGATVRNLIVSADSNALDASTATISVYNTQQITLNTIKQGLGDVKFGVLAGENNGTLENVYVNAKLDFLSEFTPGTYFVQNKTEDAMSLVSDAWKSANVSTFANATALSSYANLCYPTSLCINSEANLVPYVGYFNEGVFNHTTITEDQQISTPFYGVDTYAKYRPDNHRDNDDDKKKDNIVYFGDIFNIYKQKTDADNHGRDADYITSNVNDLVSCTQSAAVLSYRLGPNSRQAYLLGGVVGLNNGDVTNCASDVEMKFEQNLVALVGGFAGRGARGNISELTTRAKFFGTSGMYSSTRMIENNNDVAVTGLSRCDLSAQVPTAYSADTISAISPSTVSIFRRSLATDVSELITTGVLTSATMVNTIPWQRERQRMTLSGELRLLGSAYEVYDDEIDDPSISVVSRDLNRLYSFTLTKQPHFGTAEYSLGQAFDGTHSIVNMPATATAYFPETSATFARHEVEVTASELNTTVLYAVMPPNSHQIQLITNSARYFMASAIDDDNITITGDAVVIKPTTVKMYYNALFSQTDFDYACDATGTIKIPLSGFDLNVLYYYQNSAILTAMKEADNLQITYAPVYNMGGAFGEYVYANDQSIRRLFTVAEASGFKASADAPTHGYNKLNTICHFASNIVVDSSNKSNFDWDTSSYLASANSRVRNDLNVWICSQTAPHVRISAVSASDDCHSAIDPMYRLDMFNQIAPSVITTHYGDNYHGESECSPPNLGITWMDQLFYRYGLNMGDDLSYVTGDASDKRNKLRFQSPNLSGWYFNYPAQGQLFNAQWFNSHKNVESADTHDNRYDQRLWKCDNLLNMVFNTNHSTVDPAGGYLHVTRQLTAYPQHYPIYRGLATIDVNQTDYRYRLTYEPSAYMTVPYNFTCTSYSSVDDRISGLYLTLSGYHQNKYEPIYIYTYSANKRKYATLPQPSATLTFSNLHTSVSQPEQLIIDNAYWLSSNSYEELYMLNGYANTAIQSGTIPLHIPTTGLGRSVTANCIDFDITATKYALGKLLDIAIDADYSAAEPSIEIVPNQQFSSYFAIENNQLYLTQPITGGDQQLALATHVNYTSATEDLAEFGPTTSTLILNINLSATTLNRAATVDNLSALLHLTNSGTVYNNVVTANSLFFGFALNDVDITKLLDHAVYSKAYCSVIDTNDVNSILLIDDQQRPIMDIKLDETEIHSAGYYQSFALTPNAISTPTAMLSGLAINIETGN